MPTFTRIIFCALLATSAGLFAQSKPKDAPIAVMELPVGYRRLSETEITALKQARDGLILQLIAERNAARKGSAKQAAQEKSKLRANLRDSQAATLRDLVEMEEQIRTGIHAERKP